jgi:phenylpropionate dioxygenase-like ring-hydroxylating dioxygenase large terminal subunit
MLTAQDNEILTHVGPATMMGDLLRQYWVPALLSSELPEPDCPPVRIRLLCENLIAFRTTSGKVGMIENGCPHRGASLFFGRVEDDGITCIYHGWGFDVDGNCVQMLSEPDDSVFRDKLKARTYPCVERGGLVWTYMGPRKDPPPLPDLEPNMMVEGRGGVNRVNMFNWNWFQCIENNMDTIHAAWLHFGSVPFEDILDPELAKEAYPYGPVEDLKYIVQHRSARYLVKETDYGCTYTAVRPAAPDTPGYDYHRTMHWLFPWVTMTTVIRLGHACNCVLTVPIDDTHTMSWGMTTGRLDQPPNPNAPRPNPRGGERGILPNTKNWLGRFRLEFFEETAESDDFDFGVDRDAQKTSKTFTGYSGLPTIGVQDGAITWSQGEIVDRTREHLATTDSMVIRVRRRLIAAAKALHENGTVPPGVDDPRVYRQRSGWILLPEGADWWEEMRPLREGFQETEAVPVVAS